MLLLRGSLLVGWSWWWRGGWRGCWQDWFVGSSGLGMWRFGGRLLYGTIGQLAIPFVYGVEGILSGHGRVRA